MAAALTLPETLVNTTLNDATKVMSDLNAIKDWLNTNAVHLDGSKAMTGNLSSPGTDPASANEYARKAYVDAADLGRPRVGAGANCGQVVSNGNNTQMTWAETFDTDAYIASPSGTFTIPAGRAGLYAIGLQVYISTGGVASCNTTLLINGVQVGIDTLETNYANSKVEANIVLVRPLAVADTVTVFCANGSGSSRTFLGELSLIRVTL